MKKSGFDTGNIAVCAMIAALYTAVCLATPLLSYGMVQVRVSEAFTLLPVFSPVAIWGVTLGCAVSNLAGWIMGANPIGYIDVLFGTGATLVAGIITYRLRGWRMAGLPVASALAPVLVNAVVIGAELTLLETMGGFSVPIFLMNAGYVGLGQAVACFALGLPLQEALRRTGVAARYLPDTGSNRV